MIVTVKKIWRGMLSLRSHQVEQAIKANEDLDVYVIPWDKTITFTPQQLANPAVKGTNEFPNKYDEDRPYCLWDYLIPRELKPINIK